ILFMNIILVLIDSVNRNALSLYGGTEFAIPPNLQAFVDRGAWRLDNHFTGSLPCMPARREIFSGTMNLQWRPWGPLEPFDLRLPQAARTGRLRHRHGHRPLPLLGRVRERLYPGLQSAELVRGHELDFWKSLLPEFGLPQWVRNIEKWRPGYSRRYYSNIAQLKEETDYFLAKVMNGACDWLKAPKQDNPFFLQVECFDVHEPFGVPEPYASMYGKGGDRDRYTLWPPYQDAVRQAEFLSGTSADDLAYIRSQYGGKITMADHWLGAFMQTLDDLALWDDAMVIVTTDHGHDLGGTARLQQAVPVF
ncbi:MAG: sulfatase-like hydrolase/transferase, partial [Candidatus Devosia euplotis]|nr:sulfatase-like hydrolase/transferase [Candidatus Devosia euplotis]